jgi:anti-anti-sigma factor
MSMTSEEHDLTVVVRTTQIDLSSASEFDAEVVAAVEAALRLGAHRLLLDVGAVEFMDSGGISRLIDARNRLADGSCRLELQNVQREVLRVLDVLGLKTAFAVV